MKQTIGFFVGTLIFLFALTSPNSQGADYFSPRTAALGGAGSAAPLLNDSLYLNPAFGAFLPSSSLALGWTTYEGGGTRGRNYNASIMDGRSELFQAGVGYTLREDGPFIHVGAAKAAVQRLGFGIGGKYALQNGTHEAFQEATFGIAALPLDWLTVSLAGDNLIEGKKAKARGFYRTATLGTKFNVMGIVIAYLDPHYTPNLPGDKDFGWNAGGEFVIMKDLFLRGGYFKDSEVPFLHQRGKGLGFGAGWVGPRLSLDYGFTRVLEGADSTFERVNAHQFSATLYF